MVKCFRNWKACWIKFRRKHIIRRVPDNIDI